MSEKLEMQEKQNTDAKQKMHEGHEMEKMDEKQEEILYSNNKGRKSYQWELWSACNNLCSFCYLGHKNRGVDVPGQIKSLESLLRALDELDFNIYNNVSLIGGEFFQGQLSDARVRKLFFEVIEKLGALYMDKKIGSIWIFATLTLGDQKDLYETLDILQRAGVKSHPKYGASGVWVCTSWDAQGRFHTKENEENWQNHMARLKRDYPDVKKNTTIIVSQRLCEQYLDGAFSPHEFMSAYDTCLFFKPPAYFDDQCMGKAGEELLKSFCEGRGFERLSKMKREVDERSGFKIFPDRRTFRKFLVKFAREDRDLYDKLFNIEYRADELHRDGSFDGVNVQWDRLKEISETQGCLIETIQNENCLLGEEDLQDVAQQQNSPQHSHIKPHKHVIHFAAYSDSNACMICDKEQILRSTL